ncbi:MAG: hypothetical protein CM1200mP26_30180 [Acidimicrobiales bacterium]|nr:MAG: hypothetical protein CM1200mP26_30180 [Acidimicrobiales bacterium]
MQSVGEVMAIGRTFPESLQKGMRSLENGRLGLNADPAEEALDDLDDDALLAAAAIATPARISQLEVLLRRGVPLEPGDEATRVDPWFLDQILAISEERLTGPVSLPSVEGCPAWVAGTGDGPSSSASPMPS